MKRIVKYWKGIVAFIIALVVMVVLCFVLAGSVQRWLCNRGVAMLSERLATVVRLDSADVSIAQRRITLYGFMVEDRQHKEMLAVDTVTVSIAVMPLLRSCLEINEVHFASGRAQLYKARRDTAANYQFVIDAFRKPKQEDGGGDEGERHRGFSVIMHRMALDGLAVRWDVYSEERRKAGRFDPNHINMECVSLSGGSMNRTENGMTATLRRFECAEKNSGIRLNMGEAVFEKPCNDSVKVLLRDGDWAWSDMKAAFKSISMRQQGKRISLRVPMEMKVDSVVYVRDNGRPHKRTGKPHRGYFDVGHVNALLNLDAVMRCATADSTVVDIKSLAVNDKVSGLDIRNLTAMFTMRKDTLALYDMRMRLPQSRLSARRIDGILQRNAQGKANNVTIRPFPLRARVVLHDIARPFAPVLSDFTTPLDLDVTAGGTLQRFIFNGIRVKTPDNRLTLTARGEMKDVTKRYDLRLHFSDIRLTANNGIKEIIVQHFANKVRMKMIRQMRKIGDIRYQGALAISFRREDISGTLFTQYGDAAFAFTIDGRSRLMTGRISSEKFDIGSVMNVTGLGAISAKATYSFNVASKSQRSGNTKGRLPIGWLKATVDSVRFKGIPFRNVSTVMHSNGATAMGEVVMPKKLFDVSLKFWYTQTDSIQEMRFKPKLMRHKKKKEVFPEMKTWKDYMNAAREKAGFKRKIKQKEDKNSTK